MWRSLNDIREKVFDQQAPAIHLHGDKMPHLWQAHRSGQAEPPFCPCSSRDILSGVSGKEEKSYGTGNQGGGLKCAENVPQGEIAGALK